MDILKILEENGKDLYLQDLDFFEAELDTGEGYSYSYKMSCMSRISELRNWKKNGSDNEQKAKSEKNAEKNSFGKMQLDLSDISPDAPVLTPQEEIEKSIRAMRKSQHYKQLFKEYIKNHENIDAEYVDRHFTLFEPWELDAIVSIRQMGEEFLEKYFGAITPDKIARYQEFSEGFFMKHFSQLDADVVLSHGKNEWKDKDKRSNQLDVFLRLKGVKK